MKLHLGCGPSPLDGWHNTDLTPNIAVSRIPFAAEILGALGRIPELTLQNHRAGVYRRMHYLDVARKFPFSDSSVEAVFTSHMIEHLSQDTAKHMLAECHRVLQPGGICRVVAPSLEQALEKYRPEAPEEFLQAVFEYSNAGLQHRHWWMYTSASLQRTMREVGFREVTACQFRQGRLPDLQRIDNRPENSIYVEGVKGNP